MNLLLDMFGTAIKGNYGELRELRGITGNYGGIMMNYVELW